MSLNEERRAVLRANLAAVRRRIDQACAGAGRSPQELTLIAVTKFFPASDAAILVEEGAGDLGESRDQDAAAKVSELAQLTTRPARWHFVGQLQTNKARSVASYADVVHSVDRAPLAEALAAGVERASRPRLPVLIQVNLASPAAVSGPAGASRGGVTPAEVAALAERIEALPALSLGGVMALAPQDRDPDEAFAELAAVAAQLRVAHPGATAISAGMSGDLEAAVRHGATHLRIGTALLGRREPTFG
jgi:pyridoxal phosphate enzyme (YggS family)